MFNEIFSLIFLVLKNYVFFSLFDFIAQLLVGGFQSEMYGYVSLQSLISNAVKMCLCVGVCLCTLNVTNTCKSLRRRANIITYICTLAKSHTYSVCQEKIMSYIFVVTDVGIKISFQISTKNPYMKNGIFN